MNRIAIAHPPSRVFLATIILCAAAVVVLAGCGQSAEDKAELADQKYRDAQVSFNQGLFAKALEEVTAAIGLNTEVNRDSILRENYIIQAHCFRQLGEYEKALAAFRRVLQEYHVAGNQPLERRARIALAKLTFELGDDENGFSLASDAAAEAKVFNDKDGYVEASMIAARAHHHRKNYERESFVLREVLGAATSGTSRIYDALYRAFIDGDRLEDARAVLARWRSEARQDSAALSRSYVAEGYAYQVHARPDSMVRSLSQALRMLGGPGTEALEVEILTALGNASYRLQHYDDARLSYSDAQRLARKVNDIAADQLLSAMLVACDWKRAGARPSGGALNEFGRRARAISTSCRQIGFVAGEAFACLLGGKMSALADSFAAAREQFQRAIELHEQTLLSRQGDAPVFSVLQTFFEAEHLVWYDPYIRLLCEAGNKEAAFELLERKNLEDLSTYFGMTTLATGKPLVDQTARTISVRRRALNLLEADILDELRAGKRRNLERIETLKRLYPQRLAEFQDLGDTLSRSPFRWLLSPGRLRYEECQESLAAHQALVEYAPVDNAIFAMIVLRDTCYLKRLPAAAPQVLALVRECTRLLGEPRIAAGQGGAPGLARLNELSPILYAMLVEPLLPLMSGVTHCAVVPPAEFGWLPFHTLRAGGRGGALEGQMSISYLPTAAVLTFPRRREQVVGDVVALGHPGTTTWDVEYELKDIRGFYDRARMLFDTTATLRHLAQVPYDLLHIAGEFTLDEDVPGRTALKLSDGTLAAGPSDVPLGTLVSIKAPYTIVFSNISATSGGLDRYAPVAFLASGVEDFIGTLWLGDRKAKKDFGEVFYSNVMTGVPSATAYHMAVVSLAKNPEYAGLNRWGLFYRFGR